jgi:hypothetical protein
VARAINREGEIIDEIVGIELCLRDAVVTLEAIDLTFEQRACAWDSVGHDDPRWSVSAGTVAFCRRRARPSQELARAARK